MIWNDYECMLGGAARLLSHHRHRQRRFPRADVALQVEDLLPGAEDQFPDVFRPGTRWDTSGIRTLLGVLCHQVIPSMTRLENGPVLRQGFVPRPA